MPWIWGGLALALLGLYLATLCPTIYSGDAAELATAGATVGIPHPPGYALYALVGNLWCRVFPVGEVAFRLNLLSALAAAGAVYVMGRLLLELQAPPLALAAPLSLGVGLTFWSQALISEVYALDMLLGSLALLAAARLRGREGGLGRLAFFVVALGAWTCHRTVNLLYLAAPILLAGRAWIRPTLRQPRLALGLLALGGVPWLSLLYLPWASSREPLLDTLDPETWSRFWELVQARVYRRYFFAGELGPHVGHLVAGLPRELGLGLVLGPLGLGLSSGSRRGPALALLVLLLLNLGFVAIYRVPDAQVFLLPAVLAASGLAGLGLASLAPRLPRWGLALLGGACVAGLLCVNLEANNLRSQTLTRDFAQDVLAYPPEGSVLLTHVDSVTFSLWYMQAVEKRRPDLEVVSRGRAVSWYQDQVRRRRPDLHVPRYEGDDAASRWPALLAQQNGHRHPILITADLRGFFAPADAAGLSQLFEEQPAGLLTRLVPRERAAERLTEAVERNRRFWRLAWPHVQRARTQTLDTDMAALLLHYGSMRLLFARYCLLQGLPGPAIEAARAVLGLDVGEVIEQVNRAFVRQASRYHMSDMPALAREVVRLAEALKAGRLTLERVHQHLAPPALPVPMAPDEPPEVASLNMEGIRLAQSGALEQALDRFDRVLALRPGHGGALFNRAKVLSMTGRRAEAEKACRGLLAASPDHGPGLLLLSELIESSDPSESIRLLRRAAALSGVPELQRMAQQRLEARTVEGTKKTTK